MTTVKGRQQKAEGKKKKKEGRQLMLRETSMHDQASADSSCREQQ